jgi:uncharacterized protein YbjT (DUF2867 family)
MATSCVVIAGGSGVVGSRVLHHLLARPDVGSVVAVGRRPLELEHPKLVSRTVDLRSEIALAAEIPEGAAAALCCLGTTMRQAGSQAAFRAVDHDAVVIFARAALARGARRFVLVSSIGADPRARTFYLRVKGEADEAVARLGYGQVTILRPSALDDEGTRRDKRAGERLVLPLARLLFGVVGKTHRYAPIRADVVAKAMVRFAFDETAERVRIVDSDALHTAGA